MDIDSILRGVECSCGETHKCDIEHIYIESGATARLGELCGKYNHILIVADRNTYLAAGHKAEESLGGKSVRKVIFDGETVLIPDEAAIRRVTDELQNADLILGIGSGVIQDLCKYVSFFEGVPYMVVATAPSMDGYASNGAAMILGGMKETAPAGLPRAIIADTEILRHAPYDMIKAGYGDIVGKYSALCDWRLSAAVNGEYFCPYIHDVTYEMIQNTLNTAEGLAKRSEESIRALTEALMIVGIMMSFARSSRPASGSEHHLSHFFEIVGIVNGEPYFVHGIDVAYSTVITAQLREKLIASQFPDALYRPSREHYTATMQRIYKFVADGCIALQDKAGSYEADRLKVYLQKEEEIKQILASAPTAEQTEAMLALAGFDMREFYDMYGRDKIQDAVNYAKDLKDRYTVLWLNYDFFGE